MSLFTPGLVSITFRKLSPAEIVALVRQAGIQTLEWGGDVHVPHGNIHLAKEVAQRTADAGLTTAAYGSYYRLGQSESQGLAFDQVLESAVALGAPTIRVWAGVKGSLDISAEERSNVIQDAVRVADKAGKAGLTISLEYHGGTLTDSGESTTELMRELPQAHIKFLWQPPVGQSVENCEKRLEDVLPRLGNIHVFHWWPTAGDRRPLAEGESRWKRYLDLVQKTNKPAAFLLEFVANDSPQQFCEDAQVLHRLLAES